MNALAGADLTSARIYRNQGDLAKAISFFNQEIEKAPDSYAAIFERGEVYGMIAMDPSKKGVLRDIAGDAADPQREILKKMLADFDVLRNLSDESAKDKNKKNLKKIDSILREYWTEFYNGAVDSDIKHAEALAKVDSLAALGDTTRLPEGSTEKTQFEIQTDLAKEYEELVLRQTENAILLIPEEWNPFALKAQAIDRAHRVDEANKVWETALAALAASDLKDKDKAKYDEAWLIIQLHLLQNYYNYSNYPSAVIVADQILAEIPDNEDAIVFKGFALTNMANDTARTAEEKRLLRIDALAALETAHKATPDDSALLFYLGQFNLVNGDTAKAIDWWTAYTAADTTDSDILFQIGYIYLEGGSFIDYAKSEAVYQQLVDRHPDKCEGWINLGIAQIKQEKNQVGTANVKKGEECAKQAGE
jgi:tetratricopeptide (TPR) repeat protein